MFYEKILGTNSPRAFGAFLSRGCGVEDPDSEQRQVPWPCGRIRYRPCDSKPAGCRCRGTELETRLPPVAYRDGNPIPSQLCTIQIFDDERHEWMEKTDGAENTDYEPVKGGLSDAMKRAASQWGIGRYLYKLGTPWVDVEFFGKTAVIAKKEMPGLNQFHDDFVAKLKEPMPGSRSKPSQQERQRSETSSQCNAASGNGTTANGPAKPKISIADTPRYTIRKAVPHRFKSGVMTIMDIECENGDVFTVFCDKPDEALRAGTVLTNLRVIQRPGKDDPNRRFNTLESYRVASAA